MEQERHLRRPWLERTMAAAPLLAPALAMLCICAAVDVSPLVLGPLPLLGAIALPVPGSFHEPAGHCPGGVGGHASAGV